MKYLREREREREKELNDITAFAKIVNQVKLFRLGARKPKIQ